MVVLSFHTTDFHPMKKTKITIALCALEGGEAVLPVLDHLSILTQLNSSTAQHSITPALSLDINLRQSKNFLKPLSPSPTPTEPKPPPPQRAKQETKTRLLPISKPTSHHYCPDSAISLMNAFPLFRKPSLFAFMSAGIRYSHPNIHTTPGGGGR